MSTSGILGRIKNWRARRMTKRLGTLEGELLEALLFRGKPSEVWAPCKRMAKLHPQIARLSFETLLSQQPDQRPNIRGYEDILGRAWGYACRKQFLDLDARAEFLESAMNTSLEGSRLHNIAETHLTATRKTIAFFENLAKGLAESSDEFFYGAPHF